MMIENTPSQLNCFQNLTLPKLGSLDYYPSLKDKIYLNHAAITPPSQITLQAIQLSIQDFAKRGSFAFLDSVQQRSALKQGLASFASNSQYKVSAEDFALCPNMTTGLQWIAHAIKWEKNDGILIFNGEFPTNIIPWQQVAQRHTLRLKYASLNFLMQKDIDWEYLISILNQGIRLVSISIVQFQTGLRVPLTRLMNICHAIGVQVCLDGIQACGAINLDWKNIDYLSCGGHKWMMGIEGAGFLYINPKHIKSLQTQSAGWLSTEAPLDFLFEAGSVLRYDKAIRQEASAFEGGAQSAIGYAALWSSVYILNHLGMNKIEQHIQSVLDLLEVGMIARGFTSIRHHDPLRRSGILSVVPPKPLDQVQWMKALAQHNILVTAPDGYLRFSPHWMNHAQQISQVLEVIDQIQAKPQNYQA